MRPVFSASKCSKAAYWKYVIPSMRQSIPMVDVFDNKIMSSQDEVLNEINIKCLNTICQKVHVHSTSNDLSWTFSASWTSSVCHARYCMQISLEIIDSIMQKSP